MLRMASILLCLILTCCTDAIHMRNPTTGQTAECGPFWTGLDGGLGKRIPEREAQCITDYKEQGFVRVP